MARKPTAVKTEEVSHNEAAKEGTGRSRRSKFAEQFPDDAPLKVLVEANPKKAGSKTHARFEHYLTSKTVGEYLGKGGTYADIVYDLPRGFIQVG